jgi:hypothetical protein
MLVLSLRARIRSPRVEVKSWAPTRADKGRIGVDMKIKIEVECTTMEARSFLGLPDLTKLQKMPLKR